MTEMTNEQMVRRAGYASVEEYNAAVRYDRSPAGQAESDKMAAQYYAEQAAIEKAATTSSPHYKAQEQLDAYVRRYALDRAMSIPAAYDYLLSNDPEARRLYRESTMVDVPPIPPSELPRHVTDGGAGTGEPRGSTLPNASPGGSPLGKSTPVAPIMAESLAHAQTLAKSYAGLHGRAGEEILAVLKRLAGGGDKLAVELQELLRNSEKNLADARLLDARRPL